MLKDAREKELVVVRTSSYQVRQGMVVPWGWKRVFWRTVLFVGKPLYQSWGSVVPVQYRNLNYGVVSYRFGDTQPVSFDTVADIRPNTRFVRACLRDAASMPVLLPSNGTDALRVLVEDNTEAAADLDDGVGNMMAAYVLNLYGVLGSRNGRRDFAELSFMETPQESGRT